MSEQVVLQDPKQPLLEAEMPRPREVVRSLVSARVTRLSKTLDTSATKAMLAKLRANVGREPGTDESIWAYTMEGVSPEARDDGPTRAERAVHTALTLYAAHQQSRQQSAHISGVGFGQAVKRLEGKNGEGNQNSISPVRRRFNAVVTSASYDELTYHLRGLIRQMRGADIKLDYGLLAQDLFDFQCSGRADDVRRRWARQYHQLSKANENNQTQPDTDTVITEENS